jgi:hypothetical protein
MQIYSVTAKLTSSVNPVLLTRSASKDEGKIASKFMSGNTKSPARFGYSHISTTILNDPILFYIFPGHERAPNSWPCLTVFLTAYLTGVVLLTAYSGALVSFLAVRTRSQLPFQGFQGLLHDASYSIGMLPGSTVDLFRVRDLKFLYS